MKNIFTIMIFILLFSIRSFAQWQTIYYYSVQPKIPTINTMYFIDYNKGMAAGIDGIAYSPPANPIEKGYILRTTNGGNIWDTVFIIDSISFNKIVFTNPTTAIAVGSHFNDAIGTGFIARTTDFGNSWDTLTISSPLYSIHFPEEKVGFAAGKNGTIIKTTNGGVSWSFLNSTVSKSITSVFFIDTVRGFACADSFLLKTTDGGINWQVQYMGPYTNGSPSLFFPSGSIGYIKITVANGTHNIYKTTDGGNNWSIISTTTEYVPYSHIYFTNDTTGYIPGQFVLLRTVDGGVTWKKQTSSPPSLGSFFDNLIEVFFIDNDTGFAIGDQQFYKTTNGGEITGYSSDIFSVTDEVTVYPNPTTGIINIANFPDNEIYEITITDIQGVRVFNESNNKVIAKIDISSLPKGVYILHLLSEVNGFYKKIVKL